MRQQCSQCKMDRNSIAQFEILDEFVFELNIQTKLTVFSYNLSLVRAYMKRIGISFAYFYSKENLFGTWTGIFFEMPNSDCLDLVHS